MHEITDRDLSAEGEWAERSEHWIDAQTDNRPRKRRERSTAPLILCGHGVSLRVEDGALVVRDGFTHYPQAQAAHRFFRGDLNLPARIFLLDGSGTLSFEVLSWLAEQGVALARVKWTGDIAIVASGSGYAADRNKVRWQEETRADAAARLAFAFDLIERKIRASMATLEIAVPASKPRDSAIARCRETLALFAGSRPADLVQLRSTEAVCARAYFNAWRSLELNWRGVTRRPIPEEWTRFTSRTSLANNLKEKNVNASHPVNAMLNYAYAVKVAQLQIQAAADGYDPTIGIMHHGRRGLPAYAFDLVEPERPKVDALILAFIQSQTFAPADFLIRADGACRLSPQLARAVAGLVQP
jgi:CRISPR-associated endonuclease Cas1